MGGSGAPTQADIIPRSIMSDGGGGGGASSGGGGGGGDAPRRPTAWRSCLTEPRFETDGFERRSSIGGGGGSERSASLIDAKRMLFSEPREVHDEPCEREEEAVRYERSEPDPTVRRLLEPSRPLRRVSPSPRLRLPTARLPRRTLSLSLLASAGSATRPREAARPVETAPSSAWRMAKVSRTVPLCTPHHESGTL